MTELTKEYLLSDEKAEKIREYLIGEYDTKYGEGIFWDLGSKTLDKFEPLLRDRAKPYLNIYYHILQTIWHHNYRNGIVPGKLQPKTPGSPMKDFSKDLLLAMVILQIISKYNTILGEITDIDLGIMASLFLYTDDGILIKKFFYTAKERKFKLSGDQIQEFVDGLLSNDSNRLEMDGLYDDAFNRNTIPETIKQLYNQVNGLVYKEHSVDDFERLKEFCKKRFSPEDILEYLKLVGVEKAHRSFKRHDSVIQLGVIGFINSSIKLKKFLLGLDKNLEGDVKKGLVSSTKDMYYRYQDELNTTHSPNIFDFGTTFIRGNIKESLQFFFHNFSTEFLDNEFVKKYSTKK